MQDLQFHTASQNKLDMQSKNAQSALPLFSGPLADFGSENPEFCQVILDASDIQAIDQALISFKALEVDGQEVSQENFPLPAGLLQRFVEAAVEVHRGRGVCQVKGLDPAKYSDADNLILFLGIASYIGDKRGIQDKKGNVISHITDAKAWKVPYENRHGVHTNKPLAWHCDMGADILALQVRQVAAEGGATMVSSFWKVYNELASERPDVIRVLSEPNWPVHVTDRKSRYILTSLLEVHDNRLLVNFDPSRLGAHPAMKAMRSGRARKIPELTEVQREALDTVASVAQKHGVHVNSDAGDMVFINNWALLHARSAYVDAIGDTSDDGQRRHLLRLWIRSSQLGWKIPDSLRVPWEAAFGYTDEGYVSGDHQNLVAQLKYPVMPAPEYIPAKYTTGSAAFVLDSDSDSEDDDE